MSVPTNNNIAMDMGSSSSEWHSIRPWTPLLSLSVREVSSVSATFLLSASSGPHDPSLASLGLTASDDEENDDNDTQHDPHKKKRRGIIPDALAKGLSVNVNGAGWQRVILRMDEKADEAVIIIYGLMPGRQYDIDLGLMQDGQNGNIRKQVTTEDAVSQVGQNDNPDVTLVESPPGGYDPNLSPSGSSATLNGTPSDASRPPSPHAAALSLEDRLQQLQLTLSHLHSERDALTASLKAARRDAQKSDAALRTEIDTLKRAGEKNAAIEHRARQKVRALQEAARRAQAATIEMETLVQEVEAALPGLRRERDEKEEVWEKVKVEVEKRGREGEKERKRVESLKGELGGLGNRLEKLGGKKEKLETVVIPDLEEQLRGLEQEVERIESETPGVPDGDEYPYRQSIEQSMGYDGGHTSPPYTSPHTSPSYTLLQRPRAVPPAPIQRPAHHQHVSRHSHSQVTHPQSHSHVAHVRSQHGKGHNRSLNSSGSTPSSSSLSTPPQSATPSIQQSQSQLQSTLSSRAPPFEPSRGAARGGSTALPSAHRWSRIPGRRGSQPEGDR
ncbi:hypothetical protein PLICRDRAFT_37898 [Plicaturopsis crispa FD-325 SS-3]|nr:hypothetical protein PLICRDRAFT_37898 [Plicaturopsis crispa FD-325 SS-3]